MKKTFTKVLPTMPASIQKAAYANTEILFDWHEVKGFKGSSIDGIQIIVRGTDGADQTMVGIDVLFASVTDLTVPITKSSSSCSTSPGAKLVKADVVLTTTAVVLVAVSVLT